jgi:hypothetical protein
LQKRPNPFQGWASFLGLTKCFLGRICTPAALSRQRSFLSSHGNLVHRLMAGIFDRFPELLLHPFADKQSAEDKLGLSTRGRVEAQTFVGAGGPHCSSAPSEPWKPGYSVPLLTERAGGRFLYPRRCVCRLFPVVSDIPSKRRESRFEGGLGRPVAVTPPVRWRPSSSKLRWQRTIQRTTSAESDYNRNVTRRGKSRGTERHLAQLPSLAQCFASPCDAMTCEKSEPLCAGC